MPLTECRWARFKIGSKPIQTVVFHNGLSPRPKKFLCVIKFNKKSTRPYTVDADGSLETDGPFTPLGQAVQPALHAGKEIEFAEGETVLVDQRTAEGYQRGPDDQVPAFSQVEDVTEVDRIYVRPLNDFPYLLAELTTQTVNLAEEVERVRQNNVVQDKSLADAEAQLQDRLKTTAGLEKDNTNLKNDLDTIQALLAKLTGREPRLPRPHRIAQEPDPAVLSTHPGKRTRGRTSGFCRRLKTF